MQCHLRQACPQDLAEIMRLEHAGFAAAIQETGEAFAERLAAAPDGCWVLQGPHQLLGYLCAEFWPFEAQFDPARFARNHGAAGAHVLAGEEVYVSSMVLDPVLRGTGWGRRLFREALSAMFTRHPQLCSTILIVHPEWQAARRIYQAEGFTEIGSLPGYFAAGEGLSLPAIVMRRPGA